MKHGKEKSLWIYFILIHDYNRYLHSLRRAPGNDTRTIKMDLLHDPNLSFRCRASFVQGKVKVPMIQAETLCRRRCLIPKSIGPRSAKETTRIISSGSQNVEININTIISQLCNFPGCSYVIRTYNFSNTLFIS